MLSHDPESVLAQEWADQIETESEELEEMGECPWIDDCGRSEDHDDYNDDLDSHW